MRVRALTVLFILIALYFILTVAAEVYIDDNVRPRGLFLYLFLSTAITSVAALAINAEVPS